MCVFFIFRIVNRTSTEARLVPGIDQLYRKTAVKVYTVLFSLASATNLLVFIELTFWEQEFFFPGQVEGEKVKILDPEFLQTNPNHIKLNLISEVIQIKSTDRYILKLTSNKGK